MKTILLIITLFTAFQANAIYADKQIPTFSCRMVQPIADNGLRVYVTRSPMSQLMVLTMVRSLFTGEQRSSELVEQVPAISTQTTYRNENVALTIQLTEENEDGSLPALFQSSQGEEIEMSCAAIRTVLKM
jgi:hypothetical protein